MDKEEQIREAIRRLGSEVGPLHTLLAQVESVDEAALTCTLIDDDVEIFDVRLSPVLNGNQSVIIFPKINSWVIAIRIEHDEDWMIMAADEIEKYRITIGTQIIEMDGTQVMIKNNNDDLKTLMNDLLNAIINMKFTTNTGVTIELINALDFENIQTRFNAFLKSN